MKNTLYQQGEGFFKHSCNTIGYADGIPYLYHKGPGIVDGSDRMHVELYFKCDTCGKEIKAAMLHVSKEGLIKKLIK